MMGLGVYIIRDKETLRVVEDSIKDERPEYIADSTCLPRHHQRGGIPRVRTGQVAGTTLEVANL